MQRTRRWHAVALVCAALAALLAPRPSLAATTPTIRTLAGGLGSGEATNISQSPVSIAVSGSRILVVDGPAAAVDLPPADSGYPGVIWAIDLTSRQQTVVAGTGFDGVSGDGGLATETTFGDVAAVASAPGGEFYLSDAASYRVRKVGADGRVTTVAGNGSLGSGGDGGPALGASLTFVQRLAVAPQGDLYLVDGGRVRRVDRSGRIDALTSVPAPGEPALTRVTGIAFDGTGNLYLSEYEANRVRRVTPSGIMTTFAGTGSSYGPRGDGGPATAATVPFPGSITTAPDGSVYVLSDGIRKIGPTGVITTVVGPTAGFAGDGGPAALAALSNPRDLATDASGNLYIADAGNRRVRKVSTGGTISTLAGNGYRSFSGDGGPATAARLWWLPGALVSGSEGTTVVDAGNQRVRRIDPSGTIRTLRESSPWGMARDRFGNVFLSEGNQVVKVTTEGAVTTVAGTGEAGLSGDGGPATWARLSGARSLAVDGSGNLYIEDNGNGRIRRVDPSGTITTFAGSREAHLPLGDAESTGKTIERGQFNSMVIAPDGTLFWATD